MCFKICDIMPIKVVSMTNRGMTAGAKEFVLRKMYFVNFVLIMCHLGFAFFYNFFDMSVLFFTNLINIGLCLLSFVFLHTTDFKKYVHLLFYELYIFMIVSIIYLGWKYGFQHYCISFTVAIFFCDYYLNKNKKVRKRIIAMAIFNMLLYIGLRLWTNKYPFIYSVENEFIEKTVFILNTILTFFFVTMYLYIYSTTVNKLETDLRNSAEIDYLTGIFNRRKMISVMEEKLKHSENKNLLFAMVDVDFFKKVNDSYGHSAGDEVLCRIAELLKNYNTNSIKYSVCRWGGEEFLVMYEYDSSQTEAIAEFEEIRKSVEKHNIEYEKNMIKITITIGLVFYKDGETLDSLIKEVDSQLYIGKENGRNRISYCL